MNKHRLLSAIIVMILALLFSCNIIRQNEDEFPPNKVVPTEKLIAYQQMEFIGFIHFTMNTFTDKEWGFGDESPELFNPTQLSTDQCAKTAKEAGMKELILTAKHHDGFCLWPSKFTKHSIKNSPYKNGNGDIVDEFVKSCRKYGLKAGLYLSPWDRNHKDYGGTEYITYYKNQLRELLTQYGEINEIWFDGANGGDGYYGGANETRRIDPETYYGWDSIFALARELQPNIKIFSDAGPDVHWIGNEHGFAGTTFWSTLNTDSIIIGRSDTKYLNTGDPSGKDWVVGQCDVSMRPGWFYHESQDSLVKTPQDLVEIYYKSVGRNAVMLLNLPPDKRGLIHEKDVQVLREFRKIIDEIFAVDLSKGSTAEANNHRSNLQKFAPGNAVDGDSDTFWATDADVFPAVLTIQLPEKTTFDRVMIREPIKYGQRVSRFELQVLMGSGWETVFEGTTIGYKRILRIDPVSASQIRLSIAEANNAVAISDIGIFKSSPGETATSE